MEQLGDSLLEWPRKRMLRSGNAHYSLDFSDYRESHNTEEDDYRPKKRAIKQKRVKKSVKPKKVQEIIEIEDDSDEEEEIEVKKEDYSLVEKDNVKFYHITSYQFGVIEERLMIRMKLMSGPIHNTIKPEYQILMFLDILMNGTPFGQIADRVQLHENFLYAVFVDFIASQSRLLFNSSLPACEELEKVMEVSICFTFPDNVATNYFYLLVDPETDMIMKYKFYSETPRSNYANRRWKLGEHAFISWNDDYTTSFINSMNRMFKFIQSMSITHRGTIINVFILIYSLWNIAMSSST